DELGRYLGDAFRATLMPAILDRNGAALDPAECTQSLHKSSDIWSPDRSVRAQEADGWPFSLLRPRRQRPRRRAAEQCDERASPDHSITSSAVASIVDGTVMPSILAVCWLTTSSN